jgi:hypothetical protein
MAKSTNPYPLHLFVSLSIIAFVDTIVPNFSHIFCRSRSVVSAERPRMYKFVSDSFSKGDASRCIVSLIGLPDDVDEHARFNGGGGLKLYALA